MYSRVNLKMKKPTLCSHFTWTAFIELYFTVAFLLIWKIWKDQFAAKVGGMGDFKKLRGMILKWGIDTPLRTMYYF